jgi:photosystem II stability/assembly factor-like uncharacterized protein
MKESGVKVQIQMLQALYRDMKAHRQPIMHVYVLLPALLLILLLSACTDGGALGGGAWQLSNLQKHAVRVLAVNPAKPASIYAADEQGTLFVSTDGGQQWTERGQGWSKPNPVLALAFDIPGEKLYAATEKGLFVSTDEGQKWTLISTQQMGLPADRYTSILFDDRRSHRVYVGTAGHGIFVSADKGTSWKAVSQGLPTNAAIKYLAYDPSARQIWATTTAGVFRSDDQGGLWRSFQHNLPANTAVNVVLPAAAGGGQERLVYAGTDKGLYISQDQGETWKTGKIPLTGARVLALLVDFRNDKTPLYIGTNKGAFRSNDGGQSWNLIAGGLPKGTIVYAFALGAENYSQLFAATANDVYLFPGMNGGWPFSRILFWVLILVLFVALYWVLTRSRRRRGAVRLAETKEKAEE